jgi:hypothetical protein
MQTKISVSVLKLPKVSEMPHKNINENGGDIEIEERAIEREGG